MLLWLGGNIFCMRSWSVLHVSYILVILLVEYWSQLHWKKKKRKSAFPNVYTQMLLLLPEIILIFHLHTVLTC